jgi:hypothetical protein
MRPKRSFASTLVSQSVEPFHQLIEQVAFLSHALAAPLEADNSMKTLRWRCASYASCIWRQAE